MKINNNTARDFLLVVSVEAPTPSWAYTYKLWSPRSGSVAKVCGYFDGIASEEAWTALKAKLNLLVNQGWQQIRLTRKEIRVFLEAQSECNAHYDNS
jgi:hypothetical protein